MILDLRGTEQILEFAGEFLGDCDEKSDQEIDRNFIFQFEYGWQLRVGALRRWVGNLAGISDSRNLLPEDLRPRMWAYLEHTKDLMCEPNLSVPDTPIESEPPFRPFEEELAKRHELASSSAIGGNPQELYTLKKRIDEEKERVRRIHMEILRVAGQYQIVPLGSDLWHLFPINVLEEQLVNMRNHILFDYPIPKFIWPKVTYLESPTEHGITRWLRPVHIEGHDASQGSRQLRPRTRVRTWAVYFLTRRGGGEHTEESAARIWNSATNDSLASRNFRSDRNRLLEAPSQSTKSG